MPDLIVCPHCREQLDIPPEYHGRQVRCASCQTVFVATPDADVPVADRPPDRTRPSRRPRDDDDAPPPRRSNAGVLLLLLLTVFAVGGCCGGLNLILVVQTNPTVTPYTSVEGKFKVDFPVEDPTSGPLAASGDDKPAGEPGWHVTGGRANANERYTVRCFDLKAEWRALPDQEALVKVANAELPGLGGGAVGPGGDARQEQTTHAGFPALDVLAARGDGLTRTATVMRCILAGKRVYVLAVQAQDRAHQFWWVRQFFQSFEITDPAARPKG